MTKVQFLVKYNSSRTVEEALSKSIKAAVQHNKLYFKVTNRDRAIIRSSWILKLIELQNIFTAEIWDETRYENEIITLKNFMNDRFGNSIDFRISHSQKSIGVFLKHLWCLDLISTPPQCPVDRIILTRAKAPYSQRSWGYVNDIETHKIKYNYIRNAALKDGFDSVSEWELLNFG